MKQSTRNTEIAASEQCGRPHEENLFFRLCYMNVLFQALDTEHGFNVSASAPFGRGGHLALGGPQRPSALVHVVCSTVGGLGGGPPGRGVVDSQSGASPLTQTYFLCKDEFPL